MSGRPNARYKVSLTQVSSVKLHALRSCATTGPLPMNITHFLRAPFALPALMRADAGALALHALALLALLRADAGALALVLLALALPALVRADAAALALLALVLQALVRADAAAFALHAPALPALVRAEAFRALAVLFLWARPPTQTPAMFAVALRRLTFPLDRPAGLRSSASPRWRPYLLII
jgi:hypothetical protein